MPVPDINKNPISNTPSEAGNANNPPGREKANGNSRSILRSNYVFFGLTVVITIVIGGVYYYFQKPRNELAFKLEYNASLIKLAKDIKPEVTVSYKGEPVENINKVAIFIKNKGNKEITNENVLEPITIVFPDNIIAGVKWYAVSEHFKPEFEYDDEPTDTLYFEPNYMEKDDELLIEVLCIGRRRLPQVKGVLSKPRYVCELEAVTEETLARYFVYILVLSTTQFIMLFFFIREIASSAKRKRKLNNRFLAILALLSILNIFTQRIIMTKADLEHRKSDSQIERILFE